MRNNRALALGSSPRAMYVSLSLFFSARSDVNGSRQEQVRDALGYVVQAVRADLPAVPGHFQLLACDFTFDAELKPWLFEVLYLI
jgi:hypothetical protein